MSAVCAMPTSTPVPALVRSKTSTRRPAIRQHSARSCSINPLDLHRTRDGRIARAKSTPGISYNEAQQQLLWASSQYLQEEARPADVCSEPDPFLQDACASQITYSEDHFTLQPLPDLALTSNIQYLPVGSFAAPDVDPLTDFFPPQVDFLTCSPPEVVATNMSSGYGQHGSYGTSYSTGESQSSQTQQSSIPAHSTPALTYAASYSSSPPTVSGSPALSQASAAFVPPPAHAPHYHPASLPSLDLSRVATTQAYQQPLASPHAYSHPMYQHHPAHHPGSPPPQGYLPHPQQPAYGPSYPGSPTGYYAPTPYTGYAPPATPGYYSSGYDPSYGASHHAGASSDAGGSRSVRGGTSEPDQTRRGVGQGQAPAAICNDHGCNGRPFSTFSNFLRHQRERSGAATKATCHLCGATFTRTTARNGHLRNGICRDRAMRASGGGGESDLSSDGHTPE